MMRYTDNTLDEMISGDGGGYTGVVDYAPHSDYILAPNSTFSDDTIGTQPDASTSGNAVDYTLDNGGYSYTPVDYARDLNLNIPIQPIDGFHNDNLNIGTQPEYGTSGNVAVVDYAPNNEGSIEVIDYAPHNDVLVDYAPRGGVDGIVDYAPHGDVGVLPTFHDDVPHTSSTVQIPTAQSDPTFHDDPKAVVDYAPHNDGGTAPAKSAPSVPTPAPVSKNLKPYIYAGIAIVAILIVAKVLSKK